MSASATSNERLVPRWLFAAIAAVALGELAVVALHRERWAVDELPTPRSSERRTRREFEVPPDATAQEELAILRSELAALERRVNSRAEEERALQRFAAQVEAGSYPEQGDQLLEQRRARVKQSRERDDARRTQVEARIAELSRADAPSQGDGESETRP